MSQPSECHIPDILALIALGSNITLPGHTSFSILEASFSAIAKVNLTVQAKSRLFCTPCVPKGAGPDYVNAAMLVKTALPAAELLACLHAIEADFARTREERWGSRTLDLDLIDYGGQVLPDDDTQASWRDLPIEQQTLRAPDELILPHPRLQDRGFVLLPLADIVPDWHHPVLGRTVTQMIADLPDGALDGIAPQQSPLAKSPGRV